MTRDESSELRASLSTRVRRVVPPDSSLRAGLRLGRQMARDGVGYLPRLRSLWALASQPAPSDPFYADWLARSRVSADELTDQILLHNVETRPVDLEVIVCPGGAGAKDLDVTLDALVGQTCPRWRATVIDAPEGWRSTDERVTSTHAVGGITARLGELLVAGDPSSVAVVLECGDVVEPDLVHQVVSHCWDDPIADVVHWDDDVFDDHGSPGRPLFRPSWSPDTLLGTNYLGRSFALRRRVVQRAGLDPTLADAMWWDLLLRADLDAERVVRIPRVLAHLARRPAVDPVRSRAVVADHLRRAGQEAELTEGPAGVRVHWSLPDPPPVTVIIPTRHNQEMLSTCLPSLAATDYPRFDVRIIDNGGRTPEHEAWYAANDHGLDLEVTWWEEDFNYSRVNNVAAAGAGGEVLVFLNDDTELVDPGWLRELVGWATQPGIGLVGLQLIDPDGRIQHGGVVVGVNGFADHLFLGMEPHSDTILGSTDWYRNTLSVTAACVAVRRDLFEEAGGFDERFVLCGSDVVLGFDTLFAGRRNVCSPVTEVRHLESATRGRTVPMGDFHASYWRYQKYLRGGDPYFSPSLSTRTGVPTFREPRDEGPMAEVGAVLGRNFTVFRQKADEAESLWLSDICRADDAVVEAVDALHAATSGWADVTTMNWFFPDIDSPFYGGINTALRLAEHLHLQHGISHRFVMMADPNEVFFRSALAAAFPSLADVPMTFIGGPTDPGLASVPYADVSIATLWVTAYSVARFPNTRRKFYLIQDFEPQFYPAGTNYALAEEGYRLGLYGLCNTERLLDIYERDYEGVGGAFMPAVDGSVFHARERRPLHHDGPATVFVYARPGHWRNCWELASLALGEMKERLGDGVRIVTAGSWARPDDLGRGIEHLGLLDYRDTGELYRRCDVGVALTVSAHPSYLPLELMACGVPVVAFDNPAGNWILEHEGNALRCRRTVDGLSEAISRLVVDPELRERLGAGAEATIADRFSDWNAAFTGVYDILADPHGAGGQARIGDVVNRYPLAYDEQASTGRAVALVRTAGREPGVILDLGAGPGAVGEALQELGFEYVATDIDADALAVVAERGFETHQVGLLGRENDVVEVLTSVLAGRPLAAVLALDVLEHLPEPAVVLRALRRLVESSPPMTAPLVVSVPNVTHFDVGAKLLMGRWDVDDGGLLDDTHLRFFSEGELARVLREGGWTVDAADDTAAEVSDQCWPVDAPALRPGAPLRDLLRSVRDDAAPGATTYQFVRRLLPSPDPPAPAPYAVVRDEELPPLAVIVVEPPGVVASSLRTDLEAQTATVGDVVSIGSVGELTTTLPAIEARHVVVLDAACRIGPEWSAAITDATRAAPGRVIRVPVRLLDTPSESRRWDEVVGDGPPDLIDPLDLLHVAPSMPFVAGAFAVPVELVRSAGVVPAPAGTREDLVVWLALAAQLCGAHALDGPPVIAVVRPGAADGVDVAAAVVEHLDHRPMVLPAGSARRLVSNRDRLTAAEAEVLWLRERRAADEEAKEQFAHHLRHLGAELDALRPELEQLRREHARRPSRRFAAWVRRLLG